MWLVILIVVVLLLRAIATSKTAATVNQVNKTVCSSPTAGDCFKRGNTPVAGVPEPPICLHSMPIVHCQHITRGPISVYCGLPVHVVYPIAPPPIKITTPAPVLSYPKPAPMPVAPIARPILGGGSYPIRGPLAQTGFCCVGIVSGGGGGGGISCSVGGGGLRSGCDIIASF